jgi:hypothetical protein
MYRPIYEISHLGGSSIATTSVYLPGNQRTAGFVEGDMPIRSDSLKRKTQTKKEHGN